MQENLPDWIKQSYMMRCAKFWSDTFNTSPRISQGMSLLGTAVMAPLAYVFLLKPNYLNITNIGNMCMNPKSATFKEFKSNIKRPLLTVFCGYLYYKYKKLVNGFQKNQFDSLVSAAKVVRGLKKLSILLKKHPEFAANLEHVQALHDLFDNDSTTVSKDMHQLVELLLTDTFKGELGYFAYEGRITAANVLLLKVGKEFGSALYGAGEVDAYFSCAKLFKKFEDTTTPYSFVKYVKADKPYLSAQDIWHPLVYAYNPSSVVTNSIELGGLENPYNLVITGPNAGGKSTFLKSLTLNVLFAQTIGMVPARHMEMTLFAKINTYMNITDDTAKGKSLFVSEVERAQGLLKTIKELNGTDFSFSIMDEMFTGTAAREGEAATYAIARNLGTYKNSIMLLATHFPKLQELEKESSIFKNYQVRVVRYPDRSFSYPYKLEEGAANQNVAFDILAEKGFEGSIIDDARALLTA